jgi:hypothetical protein
LCCCTKYSTEFNKNVAGKDTSQVQPQSNGLPHHANKLDDFAHHANKLNDLGRKKREGCQDLPGKSLAATPFGKTGGCHCNAHKKLGLIDAIVISTNLRNATATYTLENVTANMCIFDRCYYTLFDSIY